MLLDVAVGNLAISLMPRCAINTKMSEKLPCYRTFSSMKIIPHMEVTMWNFLFEQNSHFDAQCLDFTFISAE